MNTSESQGWPVIQELELLHMAINPSVCLAACLVDIKEVADKLSMFLAQKGIHLERWHYATQRVSVDYATVCGYAETHFCAFMMPRFACRSE